jgi:hypothetical protein
MHGVSFVKEADDEFVFVLVIFEPRQSQQPADVGRRRITFEGVSGKR